MQVDEDKWVPGTRVKGRFDGPWLHFQCWGGGERQVLVAEKST